MVRVRLRSSVPFGERCFFFSCVIFFSLHFLNSTSTCFVFLILVFVVFSCSWYLTVFCFVFFCRYNSIMLLSFVTVSHIVGIVTVQYSCVVIIQGGCCRRCREPLLFSLSLARHNFSFYCLFFTNDHAGQSVSGGQNTHRSSSTLPYLPC